MSFADQPEKQIMIGTKDSLNIVLLLPPAPAARVLLGLALATRSARSAAAFLRITVRGPPGGVGPAPVVVAPDEDDPAPPSLLLLLPPPPALLLLLPLDGPAPVPDAGLGEFGLGEEDYDVHQWVEWVE